ncbi:hypothetical protein scyTo_0025986, partial [Scyliorhinus torazame]|nr:hypothetical protein [Scyliorhinus torazame]
FTIQKDRTLFRGIQASLEPERNEEVQLDDLG